MDTIVNLTARTLHIECDWFEWTEIAPSGTVARVSRDRIDTGCCFTHPEGGRVEVSVFSIEETITGLPAPKRGTVYVVSRTVAQACPRADVFSVGEPVYDEDTGEFIGNFGLEASIRHPRKR